MDYRREIDGLRALAVFPVMLFHAGFEIFGGGFVGVDVFFVMSGYLITTIIVADLEHGRFSIADFYERRARRILPALFLVMLVCIPFAWLWLLPGDMKEFALSLIAVSVFASNILFWRESGYFDMAAELKPLLHTWSLAVEEQYYVLFPIFVMLFWRLGRRWILLALGLVFFLSLAVAQWAAYARPAAAFYLLPTRGWELLIGAFTAFYLYRCDRREFGRVAGEVGGWLGVSLILFSIFSYSKMTPIPGLYALAPTLGTVLVILFATQHTTVGRWVGSKAFVGIGLISYSAYLWHQPLFAFARYRGVDNASSYIFAMLSLAALCLAYFTWRYIEAPFRDKARLGRRQVFLFAAIFASLFLVFGFVVNANRGFESRFDEEQRRLLSFASYNSKDIYRQGSCFLDPEQTFNDFGEFCYSGAQGESILVWGDSHAAALSFGLRGHFKNVSQYTASGCPPLLGVAVSWRPRCEAINGFVGQEVAFRRPKAVFLHANWILYGEQVISAGLRATIAFIRARSPDTEVFVIGGVPQYLPSLPAYLIARRRVLAENLWVSSNGYERIASVDGALKGLSLDVGVRYFSSLDSFCISGKCLVSSRFNGDLMPMAWDYGHLTSAGSVYLSSEFKVFYYGK
jgi:peptidoglycan/LPS O-acetylase OafA/YrhL